MYDTLVNIFTRLSMWWENPATQEAALKIGIGFLYAFAIFTCVSWTVAEWYESKHPTKSKK